jgi:hypothetical protein
MKPYPQITRITGAKRMGDVTQTPAVEYLPSKCKTLSSNSNTTKKKKKERKEGIKKISRIK